ncbi:MAG: PAS domain S-box protein, partial [Bacteroidales bacterium]|nr:PAS domain S-box protein [Bacteroidales bacterium]
GRIDFWVKQKKEYLKSLGHDEELVRLSSQLLDVSRNFKQSRYDVVHKKLAEFFNEHNYKGSFIIDLDLNNIGSEDTAFVGKSNIIANSRSTLLKEVFKGEVVFIPPILSDSIIEILPENSKSSMMYFVVPITDTTNTVIAALIQKIDPAHGFSEILQLSHVGETGESYVFNRNGRMLSRSRFEKDLMELGIFQEDQFGNLSIEIRDPGGNLTTGFEPTLPRKNQPLTLMAASATKGEAGINVKGYHDYRGVDVMGAWQWIDEMELGLSTEIDAEEAITLFYFIRLSAIIVLGITLIFIIGSILFTLTLGEKANFALIKAKEELEDRVVARTQELNKANEQVKSIIENASDAIISIDTYRNIVFYNPAAERIFGYSSSEIAGKSFGILVPEIAEKVKNSKENEPIDESCILFNKREIEAIKRDGTVLFMENSVSTMEQEGKTFHTVFLRDITARKKAEDKINEQKQLLENTLESLTHPFYVIDANDYTLLLANSAAKKLNKENASTCYALTHKRDTPCNSKEDPCPLAIVKKTKEPVILEHVHYDAEGNERIVEVYGYPVFNDNGDVIQMIEYSLDITEKKAAEKQLKTQSAAMTSAANGIMITSIDGTIQWVNEAFSKLSGYTFDEAVGQKPSILKSGKLDSVYYKKLWAALLSGKNWHEEIINKRKNGELYIEEQSITPVFDDKNKLTNFVAIKQDISERKKAEKRLKSQSAALKSAANGIVITNIKGEIEWVNPAFTKLTGYSWKEVVGKNPRVLKSGKHDEAFFKNMWGTILKGEVWHDEIINKKKNGELYYEEMTITPILNDQQEIVQFVAIKQDITERKRLEEIVIKAKERMEGELNVAKDIQMSMLPLIFPAFPQRKEIDLYASLIPAREVGGDFYDFYFLDENHICFVVGDVSGKGVPAALMMAVTKTLLKSRAGNDNSTASILTHVNNEIARDNTNYMF